MYVNAPIDEWFCDSPAASLLHENGDFVIEWRGQAAAAEVLPLPSYVGGSGTAPSGVMNFEPFG